MGRLLDGPVGDEIRKIEEDLDKGEIYWSERVESSVVSFLQSLRGKLNLMNWRNEL